MKKGLVTVVLPIYGVEKYLDSCIQSVVSQTYSNLEIILVDDGSKDKCPEICDAWAQKDSRIRVIHKENAGLGMARNTGIDHATGEYICFFDSDDYVEPETIDAAYALAADSRADAVIFGFNTVDEQGNVRKVYEPRTGLMVYEGDAVRDVFLPDFIAPDPKGDGTRRVYMSAWLLLYSMELIRRENWRFVSEREIISEDVYSLLDLFSGVQRVAVLPKALYNYRTNETSLSRSYKEGRYEKIKDFFLKSKALCQAKGYSQTVLHRVSKPYLAFTISAMKQEFLADRPRKETEKAIRAIIDDEVLQQVLRQNRNDRVSRTRRILFWAMRHKLYPVCIFLLKARS